jgi:hypothetical protein
MKWLARLKNSGLGTENDATKTTKTVSVVSVASILAPVQKIGGDSLAANDPVTALVTPAKAVSAGYSTNRADAMGHENLRKPDIARLALFTDKGLTIEAAELVADKLVTRDREHDDRRICLECTHLGGAGAWRCRNWQRAGVAIRARDAQLPGELVHLLQRCDGFSDQYAHAHARGFEINQSKSNEVFHHG